MGPTHARSTIVVVVLTCMPYNKDNWNKLIRDIVWIKWTMYDNTIIRASNLSTIVTSVNAIFTLHHNMRSQTGGAISMGYGILHCKSVRKQKCE